MIIELLEINKSGELQTSSGWHMSLNSRVRSEDFIKNDFLLSKSARVYYARSYLLRSGCLPDLGDALSKRHGVPPHRGQKTRLIEVKVGLG